MVLIINPSELYSLFGKPILAAVSKHYYDIAYDLLDRGANIHLPAGYGSLLTLACSGSRVGQGAMVERLLSLGADIEGEDKHCLVDGQITNRSGVCLTPLQAAVQSDHEDPVALLLDKGARINPVRPQRTYGNPLQVAAKMANSYMAHFLLSRGANVNAIGGRHGTALQAAITENPDAIINTLLGARADPFVEGGDYGSAI